MKRREITKLLETYDKVLDLLFIQNFTKQIMFVKQQLQCNLLFRIPESLFTNYCTNILNKNIRFRHFYSKNKGALDRSTIVTRKVNNP